MKKLFYFVLFTFCSFLALSAPDAASKKIKVGVSPVVTRLSRETESYEQLEIFLNLKSNTRYSALTRLELIVQVE
jgi:hypothetical protein